MPAFRMTGPEWSVHPFLKSTEPNMTLDPAFGTTRVRILFCKQKLTNHTPSFHLMGKLDFLLLDESGQPGICSTL
jgi:hypothetical protein